MDMNERQVLVRKAARAIGNSGLAHAYGHCSSRIDDDSFLVCAPNPMGLIQVGEAGTVVHIDKPLPEGVLGEVRIHQNIYKLRPDIGGICRTMPPNAMALAALGKTPQMRHGFGTYFSPSVPLWDDPQLLRNDAQAEKLAHLFGAGRGILMRGNGAVTAGPRLEMAVALNWYLEDACRVELEALRTGLQETAPIISPEAAKLRAVEGGRIFDRMWDYLTAGDPE